MPDLPEVTQEFTADVLPYLTGIESMISATEDFTRSVDDALAAVIALEMAIKGLDGKTIHINVETSGMPAAAAAAGSAAGGAATRAAADDASAADEAFARLDEILKESGGDWAELSTDAHDAGEAVRQAGGDADAATVPFQAMRNDLDNVALAAAVSGRAAQDAGTAARDSGAAAQQGGFGWGILRRDVSLFAGAFGATPLLGTVKLWHLALDGVLEAAIALGEGLAALTLGLAAMAPAAQDIYNHLTSVRNVSEALGVTIRPMTGWFEQIQHAMAPQTVEAYGGALNLLGGSFSGLTRIVHEVVTGLDDWIAKLDIWRASQQSMGGVLQNGVGFLHQFEQVVNNVGQAIANLVRADPGTAHYLMDIVVGFSKLLDVVTSIPAPILMFVLALHSLDLWGGLAVTQLVRLGTGIVSLGQSLVGAGAGLVQFLNQLGMFGSVGQEAVIPMNDLRTAEAGAALESKSLAASFMMLAASPWAWAIAGAAVLAGLAYAVTQADHATKSFISDMNNGLSNMPASQAIMQITTDVGQLNTKMNGVSASFLQATLAITPSITTFRSFGGVVSYAHAIMNVFSGAFAGQMVQMNADANAFSGAIVNLTGQQKNLFSETGNLIKQGYNYSQSLALMDLAGVQAGDSLALMKQKVSNLITGYQNMGVQGGMLANSVNAVTFATEQQNSKISSLTQGWTAFISTVTGGESALVTAEQGISTLGTNAAATGAHIGGLSQNSLQLASTWQTAITNGSALINSLLMQSSAAGMGAKGYQLVSGAARDYLQQLLPMAKGSQLATSELYALAQQAGYQGVNSFTALSNWIGHTSNSAQDLQSKVTALTAASAGLTADMQNLASAISQNLNQAMSAAIFQAEGGQKAFDNFATAAIHAHGTTDGMTSSATKLAQELVTTTGNTNSAHAMFDTFAVSLGLSRSQADQLWSAVSRTAGGLNNASNAANRTSGAMHASASSMYGAASAALAVANAVNDIPNSKTVYVNIQEALTGTVGVGGILPTPSGHAAGYLVPGYGGGDVHPALLEGGEAVTPKELTPALAPFLKAHGVPGFTGGGVMGSSGGYGGYGGGGYSGPSRIVIELNGRQVAQAMLPSLTSEVNRKSQRNNGQATGKLIPGR